ncbi:gustatory receptor 68a [Halyomorpha halys]|uniref:gustatory receptor 68a n=1 Tax=Halyomorpha halys TaxID=286706 RepID=UPI0006D50D6C|nr:gustatory receptor 68a-like [Halyomorpha halys]
MSLIWLLISSLTVWVVVFHCHETGQKAKSFHKALSRLMLNESTNRLLRNKKLLYHFKTKREVKFSAMGFFNFDYSLLSTMISTATTYIVIMVQFTPEDEFN